MRGLMMDRPLLVSQQLVHVEQVRGARTVVSRNTDGTIHRGTWGRTAVRARRLARALTALGAGVGDRVATLAWNNHRHLELYFAVSGMGAVCHTLNPRLHPTQLAWILDHAEDRWLFLDATFLPLAEALAPGLPRVEAFVVMEDRARMPETGLDRVLCYEELLAGHDDDFDWPELDENTASSLCYTSGTTGHPKGVLYSHRSTVLHSWAVALPDVIGLGESETFLPVVPMFHANAWGTPYACAMTGTNLVLPGPALDGRRLTELMNTEGVTCSAGVPTVWMGLIQHWRESGERVPTLRRTVVGGAAPPLSLIRAFEDEFGIELRQGWGMTETSPVGSINVLTPEERKLPLEARLQLETSPGRPPFGIELRIVDEVGRVLPADGSSVGELQVRGPWVAAAYFKDDESPGHQEDGWFSTGDLVTLDERYRVRIRDRSKDLIKSGGEWISSIDLENLAMGHPDVALAAAIAIPDEKWGERPLLFVVPRPGAAPAPEAVRDFFRGKVADWWIPERVVVREALPVGGTGKVQKTVLRQEASARLEPAAPGRHFTGPSRTHAGDIP